MRGIHLRNHIASDLDMVEQPSSTRRVMVYYEGPHKLRWLDPTALTKLEIKIIGASTRATRTCRSEDARGTRKANHSGETKSDNRTHEGSKIA